MKKIEGEIVNYVTHLVRRDDGAWLVWGDGNGVLEQLGNKTSPELVTTYIQSLYEQINIAQEYLEQSIKISNNIEIKDFLYNHRDYTCIGIKGFPSIWGNIGKNRTILSPINVAWKCVETNERIDIQYEKT